ncbi:Divergent protein kinase domain 2A [Pseudolycoriella hygida]|uniref:Divergent protein kinase domain 2A n=1 Tax=Pseudolycoriella hygida TaxID=35572 RepID=A0A9Q0NAJ7_9DIPT|nr:Divergent protein kinase domain 2A [Pseudolycoriella hygida]
MVCQGWLIQSSKICQHSFSIPAYDRCGRGMNVLHIKILLYASVISKYLHLIENDERQKWSELCQNNYVKCTRWFDDKNCCDTFLDDVRIETDFEMEVSGLFGNRKIQYGTYGERKVVLKYLINGGNLDDIKIKWCNEADCDWENKNQVRSLRSGLLRVFQTTSNSAGFQVCPTNSVSRFMEVFSHQSLYEWVLLNINVEPLIINTLWSRNFSVPELYSSCGFVTLQSNSGQTLSSFYDQSFAVRLLIAKNLLKAALEFSYGVEGFRIYLTDATPDNIVVDPITFKVAFVDLDNVLVVDSETITKDLSIHRHEKIECDGMCFAFVPEELCSHSLSDINLFAICQIFVTDPNRIPDRGLLHSVPDTIVREHPQFQQMIDQCVNGMADDDRFFTTNLLLEMFNKILYY